ncbi:MAG: hypothetical protein BIFFINMI_03361 [Phycisphaerae bacterium]|nr:hypothetical protein [Phycisphaerae bacterium]
MMMRRLLAILAAGGALLAASGSALGDVLWVWDDGSGFSAQATFTQTGAREMQLTLMNTSTAWPVTVPIDASNQILTSVSFDMGNWAKITGGTAVLGDGAHTVNFDNVSSQLGEGGDVSSEWGYTNGVYAPLSYNVVTAMRSHSTPFASGNLDGPDNLDGPQGGLVADPLRASLGGLGGIQGPLVFTLYFDRDISMENMHVGKVEFGSDAHFIGNATPHTNEVPEPATLALLGIGGLAFGMAADRRRRRAAH